MSEVIDFEKYKKLSDDLTPVGLQQLLLAVAEVQIMLADSVWKMRQVVGEGKSESGII